MRPTERLVAAVLAAWETQGDAGISARLLAQAAGLPASAIYYHFGGLEQLLLAAQTHALEATRAWGAAQLAAFAQPGLDAQALPSLLATVIDDWCCGQPRLAFAWRECQRSALRDDRCRPTAERWRELWDGFWAEACAQLGRPDLAMLTSRLFDGESFLHMLRWRRPVDRAGLDELCCGWGAWMSGTPAPPAPWREFAQAQALGEIDADPMADRDETAERIAEAAAALLARAGPGGVTHRAVAAEAGLTLGMVSYKHRTSAALLRAAFEAIYRQLIPLADQEQAAAFDRAPAAVLADFAEQLSRSPRRIGMEELILAAARDPELRPFAAQLRYFRGRTSRRFLDALFGPARQATPLDAAILSSFMMGQGYAGIGAASEEERRVRTRAELDALVELLRPAAD